MSKYLFILLAISISQEFFAQDYVIDSSLMGQVVKVCSDNSSDSLNYYLFPTPDTKTIGDTIKNKKNITKSDTSSLSWVRNFKQYKSIFCPTDSLHPTIALSAKIQSIHHPIDENFVYRIETFISSQPLMRKVSREEFQESNLFKIALRGRPFLKKAYHEYNTVAGPPLYHDIKRRLEELGYTGFSEGFGLKDHDIEILNEAIVDLGYRKDYLTLEFLDGIGVRKIEDVCPCGL